jgi:tRNA(fMet)-specific endonuclease VapC
MLDTNAVSDLLKGHAGLLQQVSQQPMAALCLSAITEGELRFGLAKRPASAHLHEAARQLLLRVQSLPWDGDAARAYGPLRAQIEAKGRPLSPLDLQIAAHALALGATLVTRDLAFSQLPGLTVEDWTQ